MTARRRVDAAGAVVAGAVVAGAVVAGAVGRRATRRWGATPAEHGERLPGDELVEDPAIVTTRAVTVDAPVGDVWSWLVQIGQNRGGMYSYDRLENLLGLLIHSTEVIRPEWQDLAVGDRIMLVPEGWAGLKAGYGLPVAVVEAPRTLVLRQSPPEHPWDAVWSFHIRPLPDGRSRVLSRSRSHRHRGSRGALDVALDSAMDPITWFMTRKMLLGIKRRAEHGSTVPPPVLGPVPGLMGRQVDQERGRGDDGPGRSAATVVEQGEQACGR